MVSFERHEVFDPIPPKMPVLDSIEDDKEKSTELSAIDAPHEVPVSDNLLQRNRMSPLMNRRRSRNSTHKSGATRSFSRLEAVHKSTIASASVGLGTYVPDFTQIGLMIGEGTFGMVHAYPYNKKSCAIKILKSIITENQRARAKLRLKSEIMNLTVLQNEGLHDNICRMIQSGLQPSKEYILYDRHDTDLEKAIFGDQDKKVLLCREEKVKLLVQLCDAMDYSHKKGVIHRDLKPANLVLAISERSGTKTLKIIDFGCGRTDSSGAMTGNIGTVRYMAPELYARGAAHYDGKKCDVYSAAIVAYVITSETKPWGEIGADELRMKASGGIRPDVDNLRREVVAILEQTWCHTASSRLDFDDFKKELRKFEARGCPGYGNVNCFYSFKYFVKKWSQEKYEALGCRR